MELHYVFQHPTFPGKELCVKTLMSTLSAEHVLDTNEEHWQGQAAKTWQAKVLALSGEQGVMTGMKSDDSKLMTVGEFMANKTIESAELLSTPKEASHDLDDDSVADSDEEPLVGVAVEKPSTPQSPDKMSKVKKALGPLSKSMAKASSKSLKSKKSGKTSSDEGL